MSITYEKSRVNFDVISDQYHKYVKLYMFFNGGSHEGVTPFDKFYWIMIYRSKYQAGDESVGNAY